jgi:hypothetical protein
MAVGIPVAQAELLAREAMQAQALGIRLLLQRWRQGEIGNSQGLQ